MAQKNVCTFKKMSPIARWKAIGNGCAGFALFLKTFCRNRNLRTLMDPETQKLGQKEWCKLQLDTRISYIHQAYRKIRDEIFSKSPKKRFGLGGLKMHESLTSLRKEIIACRRAMKKEKLLGPKITDSLVLIRRRQQQVAGKKYVVDVNVVELSKATITPTVRAKTVKFMEQPLEVSIDYDEQQQHQP